MFGSSQTGANAYARVGVETGVAAASPHKLVVMLFEGAMTAVASAIQHMQAGDTAAKGVAVSKAIAIIDDGLRASLDKKVGGDVALNLDALYEYMSNRLLIANLKNQPAILEEVYQLLKGLKDTWEKIAPAPATSASDVAPLESVARSAPDPLAPATTSRLVKA
jgi:flagellar protein FliS